MGVKGIFKTLIGTVVIIVMTSVIIELFNINTSSYMINQYVRLSAEQTCALFTQETYKSTTGTSGSINGTNIYAADGTEYNKYTASGASNDFSTFYASATNASSDPNLIWDSLYTNNSYFQNELIKLRAAVVSDTSVKNFGDSAIATMYPELESLKYVAEGKAASRPTGVTELTLEQFWTLDEYHSSVVTYNNWLRGHTYYEKNYTPVNIGIPYLDSTVVNKMFKWQSTKLLSNCNSALVQQNENRASTNGVYDKYVNFKGFAVYTRGAKLGTYSESTGAWSDGFTYHACDLNTVQGRTDFQKYTGMSASEVAGTAVAGLSYKQINEADITSRTKISNNVVMVVEVDYAVPVSYIGVTPIKEVFNYVMGTNYNGSKHTGVQGYKAGYSGIIDGSITYDDTAVDWVRGTIYYTLVR